MKNRSLALIASVIALLVIAVVVNYGKIGSLTGALLSAQDIAINIKDRADKNNDSILTIREMSNLFMSIYTGVDIITGLRLSTEERNVNGDDSVNRDDTVAMVNAFLALLESVCGNGTTDAGEQCDDDNDTDSGDGCSNVCAIESGYTCTGTPSVCTSESSSAVALTVAVLPLSETADTHPSSQNLTFVRFRATAGDEQVLLKTAMFEAVTGNLASLTNLSLWRHTENDDIVKVLDRSEEKSRADVLVFFDSADASNRTIESRGSAIFEVRGDIVADAQVPSDIQIRFGTGFVNFIGKKQTSAPDADIDHLVGIRTDGLCLFSCEIDVTTLPSTLFHIVAAPSN